jgi:hypothetical protein
MRQVAKQVRRVPYGALVMLERSAGKLARSVLRGLGGREPTWLPGDLICGILPVVGVQMVNKQCEATTATGEPCQLKVGSSGYCHVHDPQKLEERIEKKRMEELKRQEAWKKGDNLRQVL